MALDAMSARDGLATLRHREFRAVRGPVGFSHDADHSEEFAALYGDAP
jgi:hypothetical protein